MLILSFKIGEFLHIGEDVVVQVLDIQGRRAKLGITAPHHISIHRHEVWINMQREKRNGTSNSAEGHPDTSSDKDDFLDFDPNLAAQ